MVLPCSLLAILDCSRPTRCHWHRASQKRKRRSATHQNSTEKSKTKNRKDFTFGIKRRSEVENTNTTHSVTSQSLTHSPLSRTGNHFNTFFTRIPRGTGNRNRNTPVDCLSRPFPLFPQTSVSSTRNPSPFRFRLLSVHHELRHIFTLFRTAQLLPLRSCLRRPGLPARVSPELPPALPLINFCFRSMGCLEPDVLHLELLVVCFLPLTQNCILPYVCRPNSFLHLDEHKRPVSTSRHTRSSP